MSILVDEHTRILVQGITGRLGRSETARMQAYGSAVVAGVTPGRGGEVVDGVPVYDSVAAAVAAHDVNAVVSYVPASSVLAAADDVIRSGVPLLAISAEHVPLHDTARLLRQAADHGVTVVGPNTLGIASPGQAMIGGIGGNRPADFLLPGSVGVVSKSGGMGGEICWSLTSQGIGQSTYVSTGGDALMGYTFVDALTAFEQDTQTSAIVMFGEAGSMHENLAAELLADKAVTKPVVALVVGRFAENLPRAQFGHGGAFVSSDRVRASSKLAELENAGAVVLRRVSQIAPALRELGVA